MGSEQEARKTIDRLLAAAGWPGEDFKAADIHGARGVAIREFVLDAGQGYADYMLYVDGKAASVIEAKKVGATLTGVEIQSARYSQGLPASLPAWRCPLPFIYESTGATVAANQADFAPATFLARVRAMLELATEWGEHRLWPAQITAISFIYRLVQGAGAGRSAERRNVRPRRRAGFTLNGRASRPHPKCPGRSQDIRRAGWRCMLFLVNRGNLGCQSKREPDQYASPVNNFKFAEEYIVQNLSDPADLQSVTPDDKAKERFVIVDCLGVCDVDATEGRIVPGATSMVKDEQRGAAVHSRTASTRLAA